jgi:hypothetical protein
MVKALDWVGHKGACIFFSFCTKLIKTEKHRKLNLRFQLLVAVVNPRGWPLVKLNLHIYRTRIRAIP